MPPHVPQPTQFSGSPGPLGLDSTLADLPQHQFTLTLDCLGTAVAERFEQYPDLPGVVLVDQDRLAGMISRRQFLEFLLRPKGADLFLQDSLRMLHSYARTQFLQMAPTTAIITAAQRALRRSVDQQGDPLVVVSPEGYHLLDSHDLNIAYWQVRGIETQVRYERLQAQMLQSEKMAALGRLVDGVAHEILDPVSFIWGNLTHVNQYSQQILELLAAYETALPQPPVAISQLRDTLEVDYLRSDLPATLNSIQSGAARLKDLANSLQNFCHIDAVYPKPADLHDLLDSCLRLIKSHLSTRIEVVRHYSALPPVPCYAGQLGQVFMNILVMAVDGLLHQTIRRDLAHQFAPGSLMTEVPTAPQITIATQIKADSDSPDHRWVQITIADNGPGLSAKAQQKILKSFSVEQRIVNETSLAMSYRIITGKHGGKFEVRSHPTDTSPHLGTEFDIWLPLSPPESRG
jgi:signal transduction histidine kinase